MVVETPCGVGYGRPPANSRFQKGQSGNPGGRPGPRKLQQSRFAAALGDLLDSDEAVLREAKPTKVIDCLVRQVALGALDGRSTALRLVVSSVDRENGEPDNPDESRRVLGDRYDALRARFDAAVAAGSVDELLEIAAEFQNASKFPEAGNFSGNF